jgi:uncharacterized protein YnzC (UPF0291/DUF896 family)
MYRQLRILAIVLLLSIPATLSAQYSDQELELQTPRELCSTAQSFAAKIQVALDLVQELAEKEKTSQLSADETEKMIATYKLGQDYIDDLVRIALVAQKKNGGKFPAWVDKLNEKNAYKDETLCK